MAGSPAHHQLMMQGLCMHVGAVMLLQCCMQIAASAAPVLLCATQQTRSMELSLCSLSGSAAALCTLH